MFLLQYVSLMALDTNIYLGKSMWSKALVLQNIKPGRKLSYPSLVGSTGKWWKVLNIRFECVQFIENKTNKEWMNNSWLGV